MKEQEQTPWYNRKEIVVLLLFIFFPIGLYGIWKNHNLPNKTKWIVTTVCILFILAIFPIKSSKQILDDIDVDKETTHQTSRYQDYTFKKWYEGGTLHNGTVQDWKNATYENKLATAADMAITNSKIANKVRSNGNIDTLKPYAKELVICIDEASTGHGYESAKIAEVAAGCMILMGWR